MENQRLRVGCDRSASWPRSNESWSAATEKKDWDVDFAEPEATKLLGYKVSKLDRGGLLTNRALIDVGL